MDSRLYDEVGRLARKWRKYPNVVNKADPENRNILIEKNLKLAINTALQYRGLGLTEDELISAATEGLCTAYEKYDGSRSVARDRILSEITDDTTPSDFADIVEKHLKYGNVSNLFSNEIPQTAAEMRDWTVKNVRPAKFSSTAYFWIRASVLSELERYGRPLRVAESYRVENQFLSIDEGGMSFSDRIAYDETDSEELEDNYSRLYEGIPDTCQQILFLRYGIGEDEPLTLREIGERYGRSVGEIKSILSSVEERMKDNIRRYKLKINDLLVL